MLYPSINLLRSKVDSSYTLVIMAAKRARDLIDGKPQLTEVESSKPVTLATNEIAEDLNVNPNSVRMFMTRARKRAHKLMTEEPVKKSS